MTKRKSVSLKTCRICGGATGPAIPAYPFCSEPCRERDLGNWASGTYRVAAVGMSEDDLTQLEASLPEASLDDE